MIALHISGADLRAIDGEAGGHRIQRVPPTERRGRVHTSTVTVAIIDPAARINGPWDRRQPSDFKLEWFSGTGCGGQHRNKHQNSCRITHLPTGIVRAAQTRERSGSQQAAMAAIISALDEMATGTQSAATNRDRKQMVGSGMRGDKRRTYRFQENRVADHVTGREAPCDRVMRGDFSLLARES